MSSVPNASDELKVRAANGTLAHNGEATDSIPTSDGWVIEPKFDGWRLIAHVQESKVVFYARSGKTYNGKLPAVETELLANFPPDTWLDGEAVALAPQPDGTIRNEWGKAQAVLTTVGAHAAAGKITYMVFDLLAHRGIDARSLPFQNRRMLLEKAVAGKGMKHVAVPPQYPASVERHDRMVRMGFEGSMLKRLSAPYASGKRGHGLQKRKHSATEDVVIIGFEKGKDVGTVVFGQFRDGKLIQRGRCKRKPDLIPTPDLMAWAGKVIEVKHNGLMPGTGALRHPSMERVRTDKGAEQCLWT